MARRTDLYEADPETIATLLEHEVRTSEALLAASQAIEAALEPLDFDTLETAISTRGRHLRNLEALEIQASALRGPEFIPSPDLAGDLELLEECASRIREADARARKAAKMAMEELRLELQDVNKSARGLRGYHGPADHQPRFADKKA